MKCKGCGATYDSKLEHCPYCGLENTRLKKQRETLERKQSYYERKKQQILAASAGEMRLHKVNRLMWIMAGLAVFSLLLLILFFVIQEKVELYTNKPDPAYLEQLKEAGHWEAMRNYLYDTDAETHQYEDYWQLAALTEDAGDLRRYRDEYLHLDRAEYLAAFSGDPSMEAYDREYYENHFSFLVVRILDSCRQILKRREEYTGDSWNAQLYGPMTAEGDALLTELEKEARATLETIFHMEEEEIAALLELFYLDTNQEKQYTAQIREEWLHE